MDILEKIDNYLNEADNNETRKKELNEWSMPTFKQIRFGLYITGMMISGSIAPFVTVLILLGIGLISVPIGMLGDDFDFSGSIKKLYKDWQDKKELTPEQVNKVANELEKSINKLEKPGQRKYFKSLINKYKSEVEKNPNDKDNILKIHRDIKKYVKKHDL